MKIENQKIKETIKELYGFPNVVEYTYVGDCGSIRFFAEVSIDKDIKKAQIDRERVEKMYVPQDAKNVAQKGYSKIERSVGYNQALSDIINLIGG